MMTTINSKILKHHRKNDGTYNIKICIHHNGSNAFINTKYFVLEAGLTKDLKIIDQDIKAAVEKTLTGYREAIGNLDKRRKFLDAKSLKEYLLNKDRHVDFIGFCYKYINTLKENGKYRSASNYSTILNSLIDFFGTEVVAIEEFNVRCLSQYECFLRKERTLVRKNQFHKEIIIKSAGLTDAGIHNYFRDFKGLFAAARRYYNNPYLGLMLIPYDPFDDYKIVDSPETKKRNIPVQQLKIIRDCNIKPGSRAELARDLFMLSFYLCGMNAVDIYSSEYKVEDGRISYNRSKTKTRRKDKAFISIKVPSEASDILTKYGAMIGQRYSDINNLNAALSAGMRSISKMTGIPDLTFYSARHTFGNIARNTCRKSKDDVALALNHIDQTYKVTDIYLAKDWRIVDEVQEAVLNVLRDLDKSPATNISKLRNSISNRLQSIRIQANRIRKRVKNISYTKYEFWRI
jgi:integrase